jgi:hypothetical protein
MVAKKNRVHIWLDKRKTATSKRGGFLIPVGDRI